MNKAQAINGDINIGDWVIAVPSDEYGYLLGVITAIDKLGTPEHGTENSTDDVHVDFDAFDYPPQRIAEIEEQFSDLYDEPKSYDELPLDDVIMAPDALIRITELEHDEITRLGSIIENCKSFCNCFPEGIVPQSENHAALLARLSRNLKDYHESLMGLGKLEIISMAGEIAAMSDARNYMSGYDFSEEELQYFLQFQNPLKVIANEWKDLNDHLDGLIYVIQKQFDNQDALADYPLMRDSDVSAEKTPPNISEPQITENPLANKKRSIGDKIAAGKEKAKAQNAQKNNVQSRKREERN